MGYRKAFVREAALVVLAALTCFGCDLTDPPGEVDEIDIEDAGAGSSESTASGTATVSAAGSADCSATLDPAASPPTVVTRTGFEEADVVTLTATNDSGTLDIVADFRTVGSLGGPPEGTSYTFQAGDVIPRGVALTCESDSFVLDNSEEKTAADLSEVSRLQLELSNWKKQSSIEVSGEDCGTGGSSGTCRASTGTLSVALDLTWSSASGADVSADMEVDGVETQWVEKL